MAGSFSFPILPQDGFGGLDGGAGFELVAQVGQGHFQGDEGVLGGGVLGAPAAGGAVGMVEGAGV